jgi:glycosyltransferase involved in cell wall biosynthesis
MTVAPELLFIAPLPEPTTGQSLASKVLLEELSLSYNVKVVDLKKDSFKQGHGSFRHISSVLINILRTAKHAPSSDVIYITNVESFAGNVKDLMLYIACGSRINRAVIHLHGGAGMREIMKGRYPFLSGLNGAFLKRAAAVIVLGERLVDIYSPWVNQEKLHTVANFAEDRWFADAEQINAKYDDTSPIRLLFLSNLLPGKGHIELLEGFLRLEPEVRNRFHLDFAGRFESPAGEAEFLARMSGCREARYHGSVMGEAKASLLRNAHLFCLPTYYPYEGQPISILEAYAAGAAVLTTDHSGIFDTFTPGVNGLEVTKGSTDSIEASLRLIAKMPEQLRSIGLRNNLAARDKYTVEQFNARMRKVIDPVAIKTNSHNAAPGAIPKPDSGS